MHASTLFVTIISVRLALYMRKLGFFDMMNKMKLVAYNIIVILNLIGWAEFCYWEAGHIG